VTSARDHVRSHGAAIAGVVLVVLVAWMLSASLFGGKVFSSGDNIFLWAPFSAGKPAGWVQPANYELTDPVVGFIPDLLQIRSDLAHGALPLWDPQVSAGHPLLASQVDAPLFPLTWLSFLLPFWKSLAWVAAGKILLAALGAYLFARALALRRGPSLLAGISFGFGMFFVVWLEHPQTNVWLCLPWMFLATRRVCQRGGLGATALLGLATGLAWLGGHPESGAFLVAAAAAYAAFELIAERYRGPEPEAPPVAWAGPGWSRSIAARAGLIAAALALGVGVSAVVDLPLLELLHQSGPTNRGGAALSANAVYSFFFPELWGMPNKLFHVTGPVNFTERTAYFGALPLLLALAGLAWRRSREQWFLIGLVIVSAAVTYNIPLVADGVRKLPEANVARLTRFLIVLAFAGAVLAGYGLQRWLQASSRERARMMFVMVVAAVAPPLVWIVSNPTALSHIGAALGQLPTVHWGERSPYAVALGSVWRWVLLCAIGLGGLALAWRRRWDATAAIAIVIVLTGVDLVTLDRGEHGSIPVSYANPPAPAAVRYMAAHQGVDRIAATDLGLPPNTGQRYGLRDARIGIDLPYPLRWTRLWSAFGGSTGDSNYLLAGASRGHELADLFAVRYVLIPPGGARPAWLRPVLRTTGGTVTVNQTALPRAWVAYSWRNAHDAGADLALVTSSSSQSLRRRPVIEGVRAAPAGPAAPTSQAAVVDNNSNEVTIHAIAQRPGFLVLDDSAYPGWHATVDGHAVAWHPANENFRAVPIGAGSHTVVFRYDPGSVKIGAVVSVLSILGLLGLAVAGAVVVRRRPRSGVVSPAAPVPAPEPGTPVSS
jgi:hypothetical protein